MLRVPAVMAASRRRGAHLLRWWHTDRPLAVLWCPVALGAGVVLYFDLPFEPDLQATLTLTAPVVVLMGYLAWRRPAWRVPCLLVGFLCLGIAAATTRTALVAAPVLAKRLGPVQVSGVVAAVEVRQRDARLTLTSVSWPGSTPETAPARIRITVKEGTPPPGARIAVRAILLPPPSPAAPGAFDFARAAWFERLGAVGFTLGPAVVTAYEPDGFAVRLAALRHDLDRRVREAVPGPAGGIASALLSGERGGIEPRDLDALRDSGLAHLLAISGLHVGLVAGLVFFAIRLALAAVPPVAERWPIKKWSAAAALAAAFAYLWLTGATIPTQRAFVMTAVVLMAVIVDRRAVSMRLVAVAAGLILLVRPESVLGVSFQMSFAAVVALIAAYEAAAPAFARRRREGGRPRRAVLYFAGVLFTTLIAGGATMPFAAYHFNQIATYGLVANALAVPITALWIMPWGLVSYGLLPFGLESVPLTAMGWGIDAVRWVAHGVASWPGATVAVPSVAPWALAAAAVGGLWLCLWRSPARWLGLLGIAAFCAAPFFVTPPTVLADAHGRYVAVRSGNTYAISRSARSYTAKTWLRRAAAEGAERWPRDGDTGADGALTCGAQACILTTPQGQVVLSDDPATALAHCSSAVLIVSREPVRGRCPTRVIDRFDVWRHGAHAVWIDDAGLRIETAHRRRGNRPWVETTPRQRPPWTKATATRKAATKRD